MNHPIVELINADVYQQNLLVLSDINVSINSGEFVFLIGKTGSGKSSFMKTLYGDLPLLSGEGMVAEYDLSTLSEKKIPYLRRSIGIVFQDFKLLPDRNIFDNLKFVLKVTGWKDKIQIEQRIAEELEKVGMNGTQYKFPHQLSGGEQQRVAIARALLNDPEIILADEPTGNLDPQTSFEIMEVLRQINHRSERTILMATHNYSIISKFPGKILRCDEGQVYEVVLNTENQ